MSPFLRATASFSECRTYRYTLTRQWGEGRPVVFIGLNPSTADESADDPTIRRCVGYATGWGYKGLVMVNLFAYRATDPKIMAQAHDPIGPANDTILEATCAEAALVVAAWGVGGSLQRRDARVKAMISDLHVLRLTKDGHPGHPLYLPKCLVPVPWEDAR